MKNDLKSLVMDFVMTYRSGVVWNETKHGCYLVDNKAWIKAHTDELLEEAVQYLEKILENN